MEHFKELNSSMVFRNASEDECQAMMYCFKTRFKTFERNQAIVLQGDEIDDVVLIVKGSANVEHIDALGNIAIVMQLNKGDVYAIDCAYAGLSTYRDSLIAKEKTMVMFMNKHRLITPCNNKCKRHELVIRNLMQMVAEGNLSLLNKLSHMAKKTIREKLLSYFTHIADKNNSSYFEIPFNKTELAHYLSVDRSAMATELSKMREDGLIDYDKNQYRLIHFISKQ